MSLDKLLEQAAHSPGPAARLHATDTATGNAGARLDADLPEETELLNPEGPARFPRRAFLSESADLRVSPRR
ncbi:hypothetical protein ACIPC1_05110 [Streptomyces sp. NPDC087263]|uniref:hypothetical protein n=1 Tax=Streptomyces sp. NPDC087263 TaxID=3365773 RepID=UPI0037F39BDD